MEKKSSRIRCSVSSCAHHNNARGCCSLDSIQVGCTGCEPTRCEGTECVSFQLDKEK